MPPMLIFLLVTSPEAAYLLISSSLFEAVQAAPESQRNSIDTPIVFGSNGKLSEDVVAHASKPGGVNRGSNLHSRELAFDLV